MAEKKKQAKNKPAKNKKTTPPEKQLKLPLENKKNNEIIVLLPDGTKYIIAEDLREKKPKKASMDAVKQMRNYVQRDGSGLNFKR